MAGVTSVEGARASRLSRTKYPSNSRYRAKLDVDTGEALFYPRHGHGRPRQRASGRECRPILTPWRRPPRSAPSGQRIRRGDSLTS